MKEYLQLLAQRESRVVLGNKWTNLWLLVVVLIATFVSIAFSNGSMSFLEEKMNDPFTNWVNIPRDSQSKIEKLRDALQNPDMGEHYGYKSVHADRSFYYFYLGREDRDGQREFRYLGCRFFEQMNSDLMDAILSEENVVGKASLPVERLDYKSLGVIVTLDNLLKLGYTEDNLPCYLDLMSNSGGADALGFKFVYEEKFVAAPMPILAVVHRLPQNVDIVASNYWCSQRHNQRSKPFVFQEEYQRSLRYFVRNGVADFEEKVRALMPDSLNNPGFYTDDDLANMECWADGRFVAIYPDKMNRPISLQQYADLAEKIDSIYSEFEVKRVFKYHCSDSNLPEMDYLSVNFATLDSIRPFESFVKQNYDIQIEMSQVYSKENFNAVRVMATILSWAMIVFSIVCIILFIANMLQSYFQKVKRNLGTFKAFGLSTWELIETYVLILFAIVSVAVMGALAVTSIVQYSLHFAGVLKEDKFDYLSLWSSSTVWIAIAIILISTIVTVFVVMNRLLKQTPGDLIYER